MPYLFTDNAINKDSLVPLYYQLFLDIEKQINDSFLMPNEALPTEKDFCDSYKISRATVRQAMSLLKNNNAIYKNQGVGSFISDKKIYQPLEQFYSFSDEAKKQGKNSYCKFINLEKLNSDDTIKNYLNLNYNEFYYCLKRLRLVDDKVILYEETFLSTNRFPSMDLDKIISSGLYNYLQLNHNFKPQKATEYLSACKLDKKIATILQTKTGEASLCIERYTYEKDKMVEYTKAFAKSDVIKFSKTWNIEQQLNNS